MFLENWLMVITQDSASKDMTGSKIVSVPGADDNCHPLHFFQAQVVYVYAGVMVVNLCNNRYFRLRPGVPVILHITPSIIPIPIFSKRTEIITGFVFRTQQPL